MIKQFEDFLEGVVKDALIGSPFEVEKNASDYSVLATLANTSKPRAFVRFISASFSPSGVKAAPYTQTYSYEIVLCVANAKTHQVCYEPIENIINALRIARFGNIFPILTSVNPIERGASIAMYGINLNLTIKE